jgi:hypothetical protein
MTGIQRSKNGCWTCRLRRKKCNEGGPPCSNCESRSLLCHGYGPKPSWKDRGDMERQEASKLQLRSRRRRSQSASVHDPHEDSSQPPTAPFSAAVTEQHALDNGSTNSSIEPSQRAPSMNLFSPSYQPSYGEFQFEFMDSLEPLEPDTSISTGSGQLSNDLWQLPTSSVIDFDLNQLFQPALPNAVSGPLMTPAFSDGQRSSLPNVTIMQLEPSPAKSPTASRESPHRLSFPPTKTGASEQHAPEYEIELAMSFIDGYILQYSQCKTSNTGQKSWLLFLLMRSRTFYYASLSISAYRSCRSFAGDGNARAVAFEDYQLYQEYRKKALHEFDKLTEADTCSVLGENMICGVQIAHMEVS